MGSNKSANNLQTLAFDRLSNYLLAYEKQVIEIEVLPPAIQPPDGILLIDGLSVGIPKKVLALAHIEARKRFFQNVHKEGSHSLALLATKVILLFDPEHLTAANFRKKHIAKLKSGTSQEAQQSFRKALQQEFCFLDSILTSPLHRQSKSPTLWYHRIWLLGLISPVGSKISPKDEKLKFWRAELDAVCRSGQQHPKNYYAWQYARRLLAKIEGDDASLSFAKQVKDWCYKHPSDTSGWSFLGHCLIRIDTLDERQKLLKDVLNFAINLRCENESLWVFLSSMVAHESTPQHQQAELITTLHGYNEELDRTGATLDLRERVRKALDWIKLNSKHDRADLHSVT